MKNSPLKIFITGASGFVGAAITRHLKDKHQITAMARSDKSQAKVIQAGAEAIRCDLFNITKAHLEGVDIVIHSAARAEEWGSYHDFYQANVIGTQNMLAAAKAANVKRFIFVGTEAAMFKGQEMINIDERYPYAFDSPFPYSKTKAQAEKMVLSENSEAMQTLSLRPRLVWGPNDESVLPAILEMIEKGTFAWVADGQAETSTTYIGNFVHAIELALNKGKSGNAYFIADNETGTIKHFFSQLIETTNTAVPTKSLPGVLVRSAARVIDVTWNVFGIKTQPPLSRFAAAMMSRSCTLNIEKAKQELSYEPVYSVEEGLRVMSAS